MPNPITSDLKAQIFSQESDDPFLTLVTLQNASFIATLVNNSSDIISNGNTFTAFPMKITLPIDDGQSSKNIQIVFDNVSLDLITNFRSVTDPIGVKLEMVLASMPDVVQISFDDLLISAITYDSQKATATIIMNNFLSVAMTSESYTPANYPGLF